MTTPDGQQPATPAQLALSKMALALVTAAQDGRTSFNVAFSTLFEDIGHDPKHVLRCATNADLLWAVIVLLSTGEDPQALDEYLQACGRLFATWPVTEAV